MINKERESHGRCGEAMRKRENLLGNEHGRRCYGEELRAMSMGDEEKGEPLGGADGDELRRVSHGEDLRAMRQSKEEREGAQGR
ncbi:hypothetical protein Bca4012_065536 [Brassica carinata]